MSNPLNELSVSTPGRVCLFGEHQDYLHLPVIPAAISLRITVEGKRRKGSHVYINLPDINSSESFLLQGKFFYTKQKDYFRSVVNVLLEHGFTFSSGFDCVVHSNIPIQAGTSSSSALVVSWVNFLVYMSDQCRNLPPELIARYAHEAEVLEFNEAGGMMDQYSTAYGGVIAIDFFPTVKVEQINVELKSFVLGDSEEPKDTQAILSRVKDGVIEIAELLSSEHKDFSLQTATVESVAQFKGKLSTEQHNLLVGTIQNHEITKEARQLLRTQPLNHKRVGELLTNHHAVLRDAQRISTPKIERMLDAAMNAGAYGGKINGSGGGGCMFAYAPEHPERVAEAIERSGGNAYVVFVDEGTRAEKVP